MSDELKKCPFCGGILETRKEDMFQIYYAIHVPENYNCPLNNDEYMWENPLMRDMTKEDLIKKLNTRPLEDALQARIDELEKQIKLAKQFFSAIGTEWIGDDDNWFKYPPAPEREE